MTREEFQKTVSDRFQNTDSGFGNMTQRERILLQIASNEYEKQVKNCSIPPVVERSEQLKCEHKGQIEEMKKKADKWDALGAKIEKCYCNADGEYDEENPEIEDADLCAIGEMAASAFGWL